jgi:hypothetical protein
MVVVDPIENMNYRFVIFGSDLLTASHYQLRCYHRAAANQPSEVSRIPVNEHKPKMFDSHHQVAAQRARLLHSLLFKALYIPVMYQTHCKLIAAKDLFLLSPERDNELEIVLNSLFSLKLILAKCGEVKSTVND